MACVTWNRSKSWYVLKINQIQAKAAIWASHQGDPCQDTIVNKIDIFRRRREILTRALFPLSLSLFHSRLEANVPHLIDAALRTRAVHKLSPRFLRRGEERERERERNLPEQEIVGPVEKTYGPIRLRTLCTHSTRTLSPGLGGLWNLA